MDVLGNQVDINNQVAVVPQVIMRTSYNEIHDIEWLQPGEYEIHKPLPSGGYLLIEKQKIMGRKVERTLVGIGSHEILFKEKEF